VTFLKISDFLARKLLCFQHGNLHEINRVINSERSEESLPFAVDHTNACLSEPASAGEESAVFANTRKADFSLRLNDKREEARSDEEIIRVFAVSS